MKVKALRFKDTKEFVHIQEFGGKPSVFMSGLPNLQPETATLELMGKVMEHDFYQGLDLDMDNVELVEFDLIEAGEVGADIRNKLSPPKNLVELLEVFFGDKVVYASEERKELSEIIKREMKQTKVSVEYLAKLL